mgnify:CR=1 FL=1
MGLKTYKVLETSQVSICGHGGHPLQSKWWFRHPPHTDFDLDFDPDFDFDFDLDRLLPITYLRKVPGGVRK